MAIGVQPKRHHPPAPAKSSINLLSSLLMCLKPVGLDSNVWCGASAQELTVNDPKYAMKFSHPLCLVAHEVLGSNAEALLTSPWGNIRVIDGSYWDNVK